jgi:hypothetical protein
VACISKEEKIFKDFKNHSIKQCSGPEMMILENSYILPGVVACTYSPTTQEAEAGGSPGDEK